MRGLGSWCLDADSSADLTNLSTKEENLKDLKELPLVSSPEDKTCLKSSWGKIELVSFLGGLSRQASLRGYVTQKGQKDSTS